MKKKRKIVLAYSGGLDTSVILKWLQENYNAEVIAYTADIGQKINKKKIINNAKKLGIKVVYASSSSVYGNPISIPIKENDDKNPFNPYAKTKLEDDKLAEKYAKNGLKVIGLRYFNVFGPRQSKEYAGVIKLFLERIQQSLPPLINGDGLQVRDFVYVDDVVNANILAMESDIDGEFFNIGTNSVISVLDLANIIIKFSGLKLKPIHRSDVPGDVKATQADTTKAKMMLKWKPTTSLKDWLKSAVLDVKNNL